MRHRFSRLPRRTKILSLVAVALSGLIGASVVFLVVRPLTHKVDVIEHQVPKTSDTCSGDNLAACNRVCVANASRLVILDADGNRLTVFCHGSQISAAVGSAQAHGRNPLTGLPSSGGSGSTSPSGSGHGGGHGGGQNGGSNPGPTGGNGGATGNPGGGGGTGNGTGGGTGGGGGNAPAPVIDLSPIVGDGPVGKVVCSINARGVRVCE